MLNVKKLGNNVVPSQPVANKLAVERIPIQFKTICRLERVIVSKRNLFKKVTMPNGSEID